MPSVYTIQGASPSTGKRRKKSSKQTAQQRRFKAAAKRCKGQTLTKFRACMRRELKK